LSAVRSWIDGRPCDRLPLDDRGLAYGDGLFETIRVVDGRAPLLPWHLRRLARDCARLDLAVEQSRLEAEISALLMDGDSGVLKVIVTRAAGGRGYQPVRAGAGRRILLFHPQPVSPWSATPALRVCLCRQRLSLQPALAGIKHLNRLEQVLARGEWRDPAIGEGLMLDTTGALVEATASNLFLVRDGVLLTPRLDRCGVAGIMRELVMTTLAPAIGLQVRETRLTPDDLCSADEAFLTSALRGIAPIARVDCLALPIGSVTIALRSQLDAMDNDHDHAAPL
jgi:4-amino-4-deoxychorismate lyase